MRNLDTINRGNHIISYDYTDETLIDYEDYDIIDIEEDEIEYE